MFDADITTLFLAEFFIFVNASGVFFSYPAPAVTLEAARPRVFALSIGIEAQVPSPVCFAQGARLSADMFVLGPLLWFHICEIGCPSQVFVHDILTSL
jgi:hypothetical protein